MPLVGEPTTMFSSTVSVTEIAGDLEGPTDPAW
jgi:hypothetical protein